MKINVKYGRYRPYIAPIQTVLSQPTLLSVKWIAVEWVRSSNIYEDCFLQKKLDIMEDETIFVCEMWYHRYLQPEA